MILCVWGKQDIACVGGPMGDQCTILDKILKCLK